MGRYGHEQRRKGNPLIILVVIMHLVCPGALNHAAELQKLTPCVVNGGRSID